MAGFQSPNYTQTPNDFFAALPDMLESEIRVTLVMIRRTFGFHRNGFRMGVTKLSKAAGLSRQATLDGAAAAEARGTFRRVNPNTSAEAEWELVVPLYSLEGGPPSPLHSLEDPPLMGTGKLGVKEKEEEESILAIYEREIGIITAMAADQVDYAESLYSRKWIVDAISEAVANGKRNWAYVLGILKRWKAQGNQEPNKPARAAAAPPRARRVMPRIGADGRVV